MVREEWDHKPGVPTTIWLKNCQSRKTKLPTYVWLYCSQETLHHVHIRPAIQQLISTLELLSPNKKYSILKMLSWYLLETFMLSGSHLEFLDKYGRHIWTFIISLTMIVFCSLSLKTKEVSFHSWFFSSQVTEINIFYFGIGHLEFF